MDRISGSIKGIASKMGHSSQFRGSLLFCVLVFCSTVDQTKLSKPMMPSKPAAAHHALEIKASLIEVAFSSLTRIQIQSQTCQGLRRKQLFIKVITFFIIIKSSLFTINKLYLLVTNNLVLSASTYYILFSTIFCTVLYTLFIIRKLWLISNVVGVWKLFYSKSVKYIILFQFLPLQEKTL